MQALGSAYDATGTPVVGGKLADGAVMGVVTGHHQPSAITVVPIPLETTGGLRFQINSWSLALSGILPRETFDAIVAELNSTCDKHAPSVGAHMAWLLVPVLGLAAIPVLMNKLAHFKRQVDATCALLNKQYAASGINLRVVEFSQAAAMGSCGNNGMCRGAQRGHCHRRRHHCNHGVVTFRVDLEVAA